MITRRTKVQLLIFAIITLLGVTFVGARYARLDRVFVDDAYTVVAHFADSGGAFAGAEVSYRGVRVGQVSEMVLTQEGVDIHLDIDNGQDEIPADSIAVVGNRSALGEQYVELQPQTDKGPYLVEDSEIATDRTRTPIQTDTLLTNLSETVRSVDEDDLQTVTTEFGAAFGGAGADLQTIIDSGNEFLNAADDNFEITTKLIKDANVVLRGQVDSESSIRAFAKDLSIFSTSLVASDKDLRAVIDNGSATANQLRRFLEDNEVDLASLINNLVTTGEVVVSRLDGVEQLLVLYPYVVEAGYTVVSKTPATGNYDAHFGLVLTTEPHVCQRGYEGTDRRLPQNGDNRAMNVNAGCTEPASESNARGSQHAPRAAAPYGDPVAAYDPESGTLTWGEREADAVRSASSVAPRTLGKESWKWLFLRPLLTQDSSTSGSADPHRSRPFRLVLAALLVAVILAAAATAATLFATRGDEAGETQAGREDVMAQTEQFILRSFSYGPDLLADDNTMPDYRERVTEVITPKFAAEFDQSAGAAEQLVAQAGVARVPDVFATGVSSLDDDSARTLVAGSFTDTYTVKDKSVDQEPIPFRIEVSLVKIDGEWLVDDFNPVGE